MEEFKKKYKVSPYTVLQVSDETNLNEVHKIYRKRSIQYHPDKPNGSYEKFELLTDAYNSIVQQKEVDAIKNKQNRKKEPRAEEDDLHINDGFVDTSKVKSRFNMRDDRLAKHPTTISNVAREEITVEKLNITEPQLHNVFDYMRDKSMSKELIRIEKVRGYEPVGKSYCGVESYNGMLIHDDYGDDGADVKQIKNFKTKKITKTAINYKSKVIVKPTDKSALTQNIEIKKEEAGVSVDEFFENKLYSDILDRNNQARKKLHKLDHVNKKVLSLAEQEKLAVGGSSITSSELDKICTERNILRIKLDK